MGAINANNLSTVAAKISVATFASWIPTYTVGTNDDVVAAYIAANFTFSRVASVIDLQTSENAAADIVETVADECDTQTIYKGWRPEIKASCTWYENQNLDVIKILLWENILNVAAAPVAITNEAAWSWIAAGTIYNLLYKNWAWTQVASISLADTGGALILNTDYAIGVNDEWYTYIVFLLATTGATTVNYTYTPTATKYTWLKAVSKELPRVIVKIETCPDVNSKVDTFYLVDCGINGELITPFLDVVRAWDLVWSSLELMVNKGWYILKGKQRF